MEDLLKKAIDIAYLKHYGQYRKGDNKARAIFHPIEVASITSCMTSDDNVIIAAFLHDTIEDTDYTIDELKNDFNEDILELVLLETEDKMINAPKDMSWKLRKSEFIDRLGKSKNERAYIIVLADKLANLRSLYREYSVLGDKAFNMFNMKDKNEQRWYYESVLEILKPSLSDSPFFKEAIELINKIFGDK